jgi:hypothetical protein
LLTSWQNWQGQLCALCSAGMSVQRLVHGGANYDNYVVHTAGRAVPPPGPR